MQEKIFDLLFKEDEITWKSLLYDLVKSEHMDPWDIDISLLSKKYLETVKKLEEMDFRVSGKVVLAAAILLRIKSTRLMEEDIAQFDRLIMGPDEDDDFSLDLDEDLRTEAMIYDKKGLIPRTPQPRKRKVSIYDLVDALQKALEVNKRRFVRKAPHVDKLDVPEKKADITSIISQLYSKIVSFFSKSPKKLTFSMLTPSESKESKVLTFIPLLHLSNQQKVELMQEYHFGEIEVRLREAIKELQAKI